MIVMFSWDVEFGWIWILTPGSSRLPNSSNMIYIRQGKVLGSNIEKCSSLSTNLYGGFHIWGIPIYGWFVMENLVEMDDLGVPRF